MSLPFNARRVAVVAPHPDDEILGCGGTMARAAAAGAEVHVVVVTRGQPPLFDEELVRRIRSETLQAHGTIGVADTCFLDFPRSEEHTSELQSLMRISSAVFCLKKNKQ